MRAPHYKRLCPWVATACGRPPMSWPWQHPTAPLQGALAAASCLYSRPCRGWLPSPARGLAMAGHPCRWHGRGRLPLFLIAFTMKT
ncbi:hypothetical protein B296_00039072 [Ensete ventricosum]|uniref:Uncharacterized protein n=1 Tax=Ensete ventricosum TaxID=4639 RepID=A0A426ZJ43_ENSVE|nr:hypothetical protein B296_00039072 [Ensete ventricosum]